MRFHCPTLAAVLMTFTVHLVPFLALALLPMPLLSCSACSGDPRQAGFFCGVSNIATGTYEKRQQELTREASQTEMIAGMRQQELHSLQLKEAALSQEQSRLKKDLATLHASLLREQAMLKSAAVARDTDLQRLNEVLSQLQDLQEEWEQLSRDPKVTEGKVADLTQKNEEVDKEIDEIIQRRLKW
jgi:chromosome segregation ATPase